MSAVTRTQHTIPAQDYATLEVTLDDGSIVTAQQASDGSIMLYNPYSMLNLNVTAANSPLLRDLLEAAEQEWPTGSAPENQEPTA